MVLTPADVHNVAFSRPRIGKRGYNEQEVDLFIDLVEQELIRHLEEEGGLRTWCAELRNRDGGLQKREAELSEREAALSQHVCEVHKHEKQLREQQEAQLAQWDGELRRQEAELRKRLDGQQAVASCVGADAATHQAPQPYRHAQQLRAVPKSAAVNGAPHLEEVRTVASVHGRHDVERMAIRAVTDILGNTVTETVHERTRRSPIDNGSPGVPSERSAELEQLKEEKNAELTRSLRLLKAAAKLSLRPRWIVRVIRHDVGNRRRHTYLTWWSATAGSRSTPAATRLHTGRNV